MESSVNPPKRVVNLPPGGDRRHFPPGSADAFRQPSKSDQWRRGARIAEALAGDLGIKDTPDPRQFFRGVLDFKRYLIPKAPTDVSLSGAQWNTNPIFHWFRASGVVASGVSQSINNDLDTEGWLVAQLMASVTLTAGTVTPNALIEIFVGDGPTGSIYVVESAQVNPTQINTPVFNGMVATVSLKKPIWLPPRGMFGYRATTFGTAPVAAVVAAAQVYAYDDKMFPDVLG